MFLCLYVGIRYSLFQCIVTQWIGYISHFSATNKQTVFLNGQNGWIETIIIIERKYRKMKTTKMNAMQYDELKMKILFVVHQHCFKGYSIASHVYHHLFFIWKFSQIHLCLLMLLINRFEFWCGIIQYFDVATKAHITMVSTVNRRLVSYAQHSQWTMILPGEGKGRSKSRERKNNHLVRNMKIIDMHECVFYSLLTYVRCTGSTKNKIF